MNGLTRLSVLLSLSVAASCNRAPNPTEAPATRVKIESVGTTEQATGRSYSGTVEESAATVLSFSAAGTITRMQVNVGDRVSKGQGQHAQKRTGHRSSD